MQNKRRFSINQYPDKKEKCFKQNEPDKKTPNALNCQNLCLNINVSVNKWDSQLVRNAWGEIH